MDQPVIQPYTFERSFQDFDELAFEARQWDLDLNQLDSGKFHGKLHQFGFKDIHIGEASFGRSLKQKGTPPTGLRTIVVPANHNVQFIWRGIHITGNDILIFPLDSELSSVSSPNFHVYTCSFPEDLLSTVSDSLQMNELDKVTGKAEVVCCEPAAVELVRKSLVNVSEIAKNESILITNRDFINGISLDLPMRILSAIATSYGSYTLATTRKREIAIMQAETFIEKHVSDNISVVDICRAAQVSQRTLDYAFMERFGITPKTFLNTYRLNATRKLLRAANPNNQQVKNIATRLGYWHMGQFATDYQKLFGELPSHTLKQNIV